MRKSSSGGRAMDGWLDVQWQGSESWFDGSQKWRPKAPATPGTLEIRPSSFLASPVYRRAAAAGAEQSRAPSAQHRLSSTKRLNIRQPTHDRPISPPHPHTIPSAHHVRHARPPNDAYETHDACSPGKPPSPRAPVCAPAARRQYFGRAVECHDVRSLLTNRCYQAEDQAGTSPRYDAAVKPLGSARAMRILPPSP